MVKFIKDEKHSSELAENAYNDLILSKFHNSQSLGFLVNKELEQRINENPFNSQKTINHVEQLVIQIEKNYKLTKVFLNVCTEFSFGFNHFFKVLRNPRYKGLRKFSRLYEIFLRYCTHLKPRLCGS